MPWKPNNPFDDMPQPPKKKKHPRTVVTVRCYSGSCVKSNKNRSVNLTMDDVETGNVYKHCKDCHWVWRVYVGESGSIKVTQENQFGAEKREITFQKVWQDKHG